MRTTASKPASSSTAPEGLARLRSHRVVPARVHEIAEGEQSLTGRLDSAPAQTAILVVAAVFVIAAVLGTVAGSGLAAAIGALEDFEEEAGGLGLDLVAALCVALLLSRLGWWRRVGFAGPSQWHDTKLLIFPAVIALLALAQGIANADLSEGARVALALPQPFLTGFWEEGLTRGFLLFVLLMAAVRTGGSPVRAVLIAAGVFGLLHLVALVGGRDPGAVISQVIFATFFGIGFGALQLRTNALWALVGLHAVVNLGPALQDSGDEANFQLGAVILTLPLALYGLFLLRSAPSTDDEPGRAS